MHEEILSADQLAVLEALTDLRTVRRFYLAGGTALALRHGHRRSIYFDFFRERGFDAYRLSATLARAFERFERLPSGRHTLYVYVRLQGVTTSPRR
jgi:hypothetical protein